MRWPEIDLDKKIWTGPADQMKAGREHRVPLSPRAVAILREYPVPDETDMFGALPERRRELKPRGLEKYVQARLAQTFARSEAELNPQIYSLFLCISVQPAVRTVQPATGFQVASVHSIEVSAIGPSLRGGLMTESIATQSVAEG